MMTTTTEETIYLGAGCFWGVETALGKIAGVLSISVGYMGGNTQNATYKTICHGDTNHAEVVAVTYDSSRTKLALILHVFFNIHDATQLNRQGVDVGTQYRSCIFTTNDEQTEIAQNSLTIAQGNTAKPIVTTIEPAPTYWLAEDYHQQYFAKNPYHPNCHFFNLDAILASFTG
jgi:peptide-methionine (S)-S-oxide reductase